MSKKSPTAAPSTNIGAPSKSYHPNPAKLPKVPGIHSMVGAKGMAGKGYKPPKC